MMSYFQQLLTSRELTKHFRRGLWEYNLSDQEFAQLRKILTASRSLSGIDPRDCALYYAEWWKRCYNGGSPSKRQVFASFYYQQYFDEEQFYRHAKQGAVLLGIRWLKAQNTLYFKTLLLQGGLPINHISGHKGAYKNFLLEILTLNPGSISDFAFNPTLTSILPPASRNDEIYECCLNVVRAILEEDRQYLQLLQGHAVLEEIGQALNIRKMSLQATRKKNGIKTAWLLETAKDRIRLHIGIPDNIARDDFDSIFFRHEAAAATDNEFTLFYNDIVVCKFVRKGNGHLKTFWVNDQLILWTPGLGHAEVRLTGATGQQYDCGHLINHYPDFRRPSLWSAYAEGQWQLEKGLHTNQEEALILFQAPFQAVGDWQPLQLSIAGYNFQRIQFKGLCTVSNITEQFSYKTNAPKIDWYIIDEKPSWMIRASMPVVRKKPQIIVYDDKGVLLHDVQVKWRQRKEDIWSRWRDAVIPAGWTELQITAANVTETDSFFNIGHLSLEVDSQQLSEAKVRLLHNNFSFTIQEQPLIIIKPIGNTAFTVQLASPDKVPSAIQANLRHGSTQKSLAFEIQPPFTGVEVLDNMQNIIPDKSTFTLQDLRGMRLMANRENLAINLYNNNRKDILITEKLGVNLTPLRLFEDKIIQLFSFSDAMHASAEVIMEIGVEIMGRYTALRQYNIKRFRHRMEIKSAGDDLIILTSDAGIPAVLMAVPLDGAPNLLQLEQRGSDYVLEGYDNCARFLIFSSRDSPVRTKPIVVARNFNGTTLTRLAEQEEAIAYSKRLIEEGYSGECWEKMLEYYRICRNHDLPFSAFVLLRAAAGQPALAARLFVLLFCFEDGFVEESVFKMEYDLGLSFHWLGKDDWGRTMEWMGCYGDPSLFALVSAGIRKYFCEQYPAQYFEAVCQYIFTDTKPSVAQGYHLRAKVAQLRSMLGERVLSQLPSRCPKIPDQYKELLPVDESNASVKILLKSPAAVALSIAGLDDSLWELDNEIVRRNVKYSQHLDPSWYSEAICYCLYKI